MKLAIVAHNVVRGDGQGRINFELVKEALRQGIEVRLISARVDPEILDAGVLWEKIEVRPPILRQIIQFARAADRVIETHRRAGWFDRIIANGYTTTRVHDVNLCQYVHAAWLRSPAHGGRGLVNRVYQQLYTRYNVHKEKSAYAAAQVVVAPSHKTAGELEGIGVPSEKMCIIPNGVDVEEFHPGPEDRTALGLPQDVPLALFVGDLRTNRKGLRHILDAMRSLPAVHLAVVGKLDGSPFPGYVKQLEIESRVHFLGFRRDVAALMRACDIFVFPTSYEACALVVLESLASGMPVITSSAAGSSELMTPQCGTVIDNSNDVKALEAALSRWMSDPAARKQASAASREVALKHTWSSMAQSYLRLLDDDSPTSRDRQQTAIPIANER